MWLLQQLFDLSLKKFYLLLINRDKIVTKKEGVCYSRESIEKDIKNMSKLELDEFAEKFGIKLDRRRSLERMKIQFFEELEEQHFKKE